LLTFKLCVLIEFTPIVALYKSYGEMLKLGPYCVSNSDKRDFP